MLKVKRLQSRSVKVKMDYCQRFSSIIHRLRAISEKCEMGRKVVAGLFYNRKGLVSTGHNSYRTYVNRGLLSNFHAEMEAIYHFERQNSHQARKKKKDLKLIVIRITVDGMLANSTPCVRCRELIHSYGIRKIYYINEFGKLVSDELKQYNQALDSIIQRCKPNSLLKELRENFKEELPERCFSGSLLSEIWFKHTIQHNVEYLRKINYALKRF